ncbi:hypothetical protein E3N88_19340 [Mikania micrantha]|uniref:Uncharacterized protein n=1 Tax=Mikania micrantha TaxID=192012 RepID=A0A5N6NNE9_9ASTR|nr:hypothetical protein E3N88_19340 [Mikania micrantha]
MKRDLISTQRACRSRLKPCVDAINVKAVVALRQPTVALASVGFLKTYGAEQGFAGGGFGGEDGESVAVVDGFEYATEDESGDDGDDDGGFVGGNVRTPAVLIRQNEGAPQNPKFQTNLEATAATTNGKIPKSNHFVSSSSPIVEFEALWKPSRQLPVVSLTLSSAIVIRHSHLLNSNNSLSVGDLGHRHQPDAAVGCACAQGPGWSASPVGCRLCAGSQGPSAVGCGAVRSSFRVVLHCCCVWFVDLNVSFFNFI